MRSVSAPLGGYKLIKSELGAYVAIRELSKRMSCSRFVHYHAYFLDGPVSHSGFMCKYVLKYDQLFWKSLNSESAQIIIAAQRPQ